MRLSFAPPIETRDGVSDKDSRMTNMLSDSGKAISRPGLSFVSTIGANQYGKGLFALPFPDNFLTTDGSASLDPNAPPKWSMELVAATGNAATPTDGVVTITVIDTKENATTDLGLDLVTYHVVFDGTNYVTLGFDGISGEMYLVTSPDGLTWQSTNLGAQYQRTRFIYADSIFVAIPHYGTTSNSMTSSDGVNWTIGTDDTKFVADVSMSYPLTYSETLDKFFAGGPIFNEFMQITGWQALSSSDGLAWTTHELPENFPRVREVVSTASFVVVRGNDDLASSTDGTTFTSVTAPSLDNPDDNWDTLSVSGDYIYLFSYLGQIVRSKDLSSWETMTRVAPLGDGGVELIVTGSGLTNEVFAVLWTFASALSDYKLSISTDGCRTWTRYDCDFEIWGDAPAGAISIIDDKCFLILTQSEAEMILFGTFPITIDTVQGSGAVNIG